MIVGRKSALAVLLVAGAFAWSSAVASERAKKPTGEPDPALHIQIGEPMPDFKFLDVRNAPEDFEVTREALKGKVVVLDFWGPFCAPCLSLFPHMNNMHEKFKDKGVVFVAIADQPFDRCEPKLKKHPLNFIQVFDINFAAFKAFGVSALPRTVIIGKDGNVAAYTRPGRINTEVLEAVLAGKPIDSFYRASEFQRKKD